MDLIEYVNVLRRRWVSILALAILGAAVGYGWSSTITPTYQASSQVFVSVNSGDTVNDLVQGSTFTQNLVQSYAQLVATPAVLAPVIDDLSLETTPKKLAKSVQANTPLNTVIVEISVTDSTPSRAAEIANAIADQLPKTVTGLSPSRGGTITSGEAVVSIKTIADASVPDFAISPNK
ncbi:Wzz/FepE/Etk N-terminal domain-containing protein, partial [Aeromicrobium sp.]|uniref:YveK family protein n=1 Tax=Aeromicrobium sp. TaxID=1871063 RepID=UPI0025BD69C1